MKQTDMLNAFKLQKKSIANHPENVINYEPLQFGSEEENEGKGNMKSMVVVSSSMKHHHQHPIGKPLCMGFQMKTNLQLAVVKGSAPNGKGSTTKKGKGQTSPNGKEGKLLSFFQRNEKANKEEITVEAGKKRVITPEAGLETAIIQEERSLKRRKVDDMTCSTQVTIKSQDTDVPMSQSLPSTQQDSQVPNHQKLSTILSSSTLSLLKSLKKGPRQQIQQSTNLLDGRPASISTETSSMIETLKKEIPRKIEVSPTLNELLKPENSMKEKHKELLKTSRELVLPIHYKKLLEIVKLVDSSLNFLKSCRRQNGFSFDELKKSVEKSGRQLDISSFRQILFVAPDFFNHRWEHQRSECTLFVEFPDNSHLGGTFFEDRLKEFKNALLALTKKHYEKHVSSLIQEEEKQSIENSLLKADPFKTQMWHHTFDPHTVPSIPMADLKPQPTHKQVVRSESVKDFLDKSKLTSLIEQKRDQTIVRASPVQCSTSSDLKLVNMSQKTGLSIETLKLIQSKQEALKNAKSTLNDTMAKDEGAKTEQDMCKLADMIRSTLEMRQKQTLSMKDALQALKDNLRGQFRSQGDQLALITQLSKLVPEWLTIKEIGQAGKFISCNLKQYTGIQVQDLIRKRLGEQVKDASPK